MRIPRWDHFLSFQHVHYHISSVKEEGSEILRLELEQLETLPIMSVWNFGFFFLSLTSYYLLVLGVEGYCCIWSHSMIQTQSVGRQIGPTQRPLPDKHTTHTPSVGRQIGPTQRPLPDNTHTVGRTTDQPDAETSTWQHTSHTPSVGRQIDPTQRPLPDNTQHTHRR
jgi:hypothetical protein